MTPQQSVSTGHPIMPDRQPGVVTARSHARLGVASAGDGTAPGRRLGELDALRGLAAVAVLLHHSLLSGGFLAGPLGRWLAATPLQPIQSGRPAVMFFFMLSGFVLCKALRDRGFELSARSWAAWAAQRTIRLCLPVLASVALSLLLYAVVFDGTWPTEGEWLRERVWQHPPTLGTVASNGSLLALDGEGYALNNVLWSLVHEWRFSMLVPVLLALPVLGARGTASLVLAATAVSSWAGGMYGWSLFAGAGVVGTIKASLYFSLPFILGMALELGAAARWPADRWLTVLGLAAVLGLCRNGSDYAIFIASAILIWLSLQPGPMQRALRRPAPRFLGTVSFSLYLVHVPVLAAVQHGLHDRLPPAALWGIGILCSLLAAWVFCRVVERPAHRLARRVDRMA